MDMEEGGLRTRRIKGIQDQREKGYWSVTGKMVNGKSKWHCTFIILLKYIFTVYYVYV